MRKELKLDFIRPILLENGSSKNSLFLLTKSQKGMMLMNSIAFKKSEDGKGINIKKQINSLFGTAGTAKFNLFAINLREEIKQKKQMTNHEIIKFTAMEEFLPKHAKFILKELKEKGEIKIFDHTGKEIECANKFYIAEEPKNGSIIKSQF